MKRVIWIGLLAVLAFALIIAIRLPASWLGGFLPAGVGCVQLSGTAWNGVCSGFVAQGNSFGDLSWKLHATELLKGKVATHIEIQGPAGTAAGEISMAGKTLDAQGLRADFALDPALLPQVPPDLRGRIHADLSRLQIEDGIIRSIVGRIDALDLRNRDSLGDYLITFPSTAAPASEEPVGDVRSVKGPLRVEATLRLTAEPGFELQGLIAAAPGAPPELLKNLRILGRPDPQGRRPFSAAGTF